MRRTMKVLSAILSAGLALMGALTMSLPAPASGTTIGPKQHFAGLVNGKRTNVVIRVVCPGPAGGRRTGPPAGGQSVSIERVRSGRGYTGSSAHEIWVKFGADSRHVVGFTSYGVRKTIPRALQLPCRGTGKVTFTTCFGTQPCSATAQDDHVRVTYENIAV